MASADYHTCDHCGERKTFYDADMEVECVDGHWRYNWAKGGDGYPAFPGYRVFSLCNECEKTHEIVIRAQGIEAGTGETAGLDPQGESPVRQDAPDYLQGPPLRDNGPLETMARAERFYIDCEFDGHNGALLSLAIVPESPVGLSAHIRVMQDATDPWVIENVVPLLDQHDADLIWEVRPQSVGMCIRQSLEHSGHPVIVADSPVDIYRFCRALSTGEDGGWVSAEYANMTFEVHNVDCYPTDLPGAVQHNAWWDAMALRHKLAAPPIGTKEGE